MKTLNPTRYSLLISKWMESGDVMTPVDINRIEPFILGLRSDVRIDMGSSLKDLRIRESEDLNALLRGNYVIYTHKDSISVCLKSGCSYDDMLEAFYFAIVAASSSDCSCFLPTQDNRKTYLNFRTLVKDQGWDLSFAPLGASETRFTLVQ